MGPILPMLWGCASSALRTTEADVARLEGEIDALRAEIGVLEAHAPSQRPTRPKGRCLTLDVLGDGTSLLEGATRRKGKAQGGGFELGAVQRGSFWALARARKGDIVLSVAGVRLERKPDAGRAIEAVRAAGAVPVVVELERGGETERLTVDPWCR